VVIADGELLAYLERGGQRLWTFPSETPLETRIVRVAAALPGLFADRARATLHLAEIDGEPAARSPWATGLARAGFRPGYKGLDLERSALRTHA
jgi:hypothetical protein